jgi:hypothetical protein
MTRPNRSSALGGLLLVGLVASVTSACPPDCNEPVAGFTAWPTTTYAGKYVVAIDTSVHSMANGQTVTTLKLR